MENDGVSDSSSAEDQIDLVASEKQKVKKKRKIEKPGVIYLSSVPDFMSVQKLRNVFSEYGEINRTFFQPVEKSFKFKKGLLFTEGWVEFKNRTDAQCVAATLNNSQVGGKKRNPWFSCIWNMKYLPKFTWTDVNADRELKRATYDSRIRADISQVKKQTHFYKNNIERSKTLSEMKKRKEARGETFEKRALEGGVRQRLTEDEIVSQKRKKRKADTERDEGDKEAKKQMKTFGSDAPDASRQFVMKNIFGSSSSR